MKVSEGAKEGCPPRLHMLLMTEGAGASVQRPWRHAEPAPCPRRHPTAPGVLGGLFGPCCTCSVGTLGHAPVPLAAPAHSLPCISPRPFPQPASQLLGGSPATPRLTLRTTSRMPCPSWLGSSRTKGRTCSATSCRADVIRPRLSITWRRWRCVLCCYGNSIAARQAVSGRCQSYRGHVWREWQGCQANSQGRNTGRHAMRRVAEQGQGGAGQGKRVLSLGGALPQGYTSGTGLTQNLELASFASMSPTFCMPGRVGAA